MIFFLKQKTAYEMRISDWNSDVCSSDLWEVNEPAMLAKVLDTLGGLRGNLSLADAIVLGGVVGLEKAIKDAGFGVAVPFTGGRGDATDEQTDADSFAVMEPEADAFRNSLGKKQLAVKTAIGRAHV